MTLKHFQRALGVLLMIDGALKFLLPTEYPRKLQMGNPQIDDMLDYLTENPTFTRRLSAGEIALGLWLALR